MNLKFKKILLKCDKDEFVVDVKPAELVLVSKGFK